MSHFLQRTSLIALMASALGACSTYSAEAMRPSYPIRAAEPQAPAAQAPVAVTPAPAPAVTLNDAPIQVAPAAPVQSTTLAPLAPSELAAQDQANQQPTLEEARRAPPVAAARRPAPVAPSYRTVTTRSVTGRVVEVDGPPETYEVRKGDTLEKIARKLGTTVAQLREDNDLGKRSTIRPGQELKGPTSSAKAYTVGQGDTLFAIARRFGVNADDIAAENNLTRARSLRTGQKLRLPAGFKDKGPVTTTARVLVEGGSAPTPADQDTPDVAETALQRPAPGRPSRATPVAVPSATAAPAYRTTTKRSVTGRVVDVEGPAVSYTVKKGDNLEKIADRLNTTVDQLKDDNKLRRSTIRPGQKLKGPRSDAKAYVAGSGDTLAQIGKRFGVSAEALRAENGLSRNAAVRSGQRLRLPNRYRDRGPITETIRTAIAPPEEAPPRAAAAEPMETPPRPAAPLPSRPQPYASPAQTAPVQTVPPQTAPAPAPAQVAPRPYTPPPSSSAPAVAPTSAPAVGDAQISELGRGRFVWPLQGAIVSDFGPKGGGQRNDGINIGASAGASIRAAAPGDVVYAGDQVPGFGNLVLIKHADGWVTAYGHLARVDVKMQQKVTQGQQIGQAGMSGGVSEPQLHFEVRYAPSPLERARPIDPKLVLPR